MIDGPMINETGRREVDSQRVARCPKPRRSGPTHLQEQHIDRIRQRRDYLILRIEIKNRMGWESVYDESERDAHTWALERLAATT